MVQRATPTSSSRLSLHDSRALIDCILPDVLGVARDVFDNLFPADAEFEARSVGYEGALTGLLSKRERASRQDMVEEVTITAGTLNPFRVGLSWV